MDPGREEEIRMRLQKYMAECGVAARRKCEEIIREGRVSINGVVVTEMGTQVQPEDEVLLDGKKLTPEDRKVVILYYKPIGEVTTVQDDRGRETVMDRFRELPWRIFPVGRLDYDTEGVLLLTNDGELAENLTHPSREVDKSYLARIVGQLTVEETDRLRRGILLEGEERRTWPAKVRVLRTGEIWSEVMVTIHEGRNRQVRRMFEAVGHRVILLRRIRFGSVTLGNLKRGEWRELSEEEIQVLREI